MERLESVIKSLAEAGLRGLAIADLAKNLHVSAKQISTLLQQLKSSGSVRGPFSISRSKRYFTTKHAPTREQVEVRLEETLRDAGLKLTSFSDLQAIARFAPKAFFKDALSAPKADAKIVELRGPRRSKLYFHRDPVLEQLRVEATIRDRLPSSEPISLECVRPVYEALKAQQGGVSAVTIFEVLQRVGGSKEDLHRLLLDEAKRGRVTLHPASTVNFAREVMEAGIELEGQPYPFVTVVLKEGA
jgi:hypothetical protein